MPTLTDWTTSHTYQTLKEAQTTKAREHRARLQFQATQAETVVAHEGWQTFLNLLATEITTRQAHYDSLARQILLGDSAGDMLMSQKVLLNRIEGQIAGLTLARDLIPALIKQGRVITPPIS